MTDPLAELEARVQERLNVVSLALGQLLGPEKRDEYSRQHGRKAAYNNVLEMIEHLKERAR
jgi:hypothetical protein